MIYATTGTLPHTRPHTTAPFTLSITYPTRRRFLITAGGSILITAAGCAGGDGATMDSPPPSAATRRIKHALGETEVPVEPQRIVVVGYNEAEDLAALDIRPVGVMYDAGARSFLADALNNVPVVGIDNQPNLEKIATLDPDLILGVDWATEELYDRLSTIAPTVVVDRGDGFERWREQFEFIADVVGRTERATELLAAYDQRTAQIRQALAARQLDTTEVSVFGSWNAEYAVFNYVEGFPITVLNAVGLEVVASQREIYRTNPTAFDGMSLELLPQLDADIIFFLDSTIEGQEGDKEFVNAVKTHPLFQQLRAVQNGNVCEVPYGRWNEGSILAAHLILDDVERCLLEGA